MNKPVTTAPIAQPVKDNKIMETEKMTLAQAATLAQQAGINIADAQGSITSAQEVLIKRLRKSCQFHRKSKTGRSAHYSFMLALAANMHKMSLTEYILAAPVTHLPATAHVC